MLKVQKLQTQQENKEETVSSGVARHAINYDEALARLRAGNNRFVQNVRCVEAMASQYRRDELVMGQSPFAIILCCSDSRAPTELLFDAGLGELFVVRVAGNIVAPSIVGSIEFAASTFGTELVVVMGHTRCGAISATVKALTGATTDSPSENIRDIVDRITPGIANCVPPNSSHDDVIHQAIRANIQATTDHLRNDSAVLRNRIQEGRLMIVGAEYALETGHVDFFDLPSLPNSKT
jgi:carbonic anhydrase